jgi:pyruvate, water dikinase
LTDAEVEQLARYALIIEQHYGRPMDIEWGKDGIDGKLYILQARPETVKSQQRARSSSATSSRAQGHRCWPKAVPSARKLVPARCAWCTHQPDGSGAAGDVLVTDMTDPNWEPVMKRASAIVTNRGGRTCHAAIIARELGIPAVVGCGDATETLQTVLVTVRCAPRATPATSTTALLETEVTEVQKRG